MTTPVQVPNSEASFRTYLESLGRLMATMLIVTYGVGFVVLAIHESQYGILQFSPLRSRTLMVGFTFIFLSAISIGAYEYGFARFPLLRPIVENTDAAVQRERLAVLGGGFIFTAYVMAGLLSFVGGFVSNSSPPQEWKHPWGAGIAFMAANVVAFGTYFWIGKNFSNHPKRSASFAGIAVALFIGSRYAIGSEIVGGLTFWFFIAAALWHSVRRSIDGLKYILDFRNWVFIIFAVSTYVFSVFGNIRPELGGGAPTPVVLDLQKPIASLGQSIADVVLLDETNEGFYVLPPGQKKALFVPRGEVNSVFFGSLRELQKPK